MEQMIEIGSKVSFIHEGAGWRIFGVVSAMDGDSVTINADGRMYEASLELDDIRAEAP